MTIMELIELWKATDVTKSLNQIKDTDTFIYSLFFKNNMEGKKSNKVEIPIKRGSGTILTSIAPTAEHLYQDRADEYLLDLTLPRFALQDTISAAEINDLKSFDTPDQKAELATIIGNIQKEHLNSFLTTLEYMAAGSLFGKIIDGEGKILFEFKSENDSIEVKSNEDPIDFLRTIDKKIVAELGKNSTYTGLASDEFMDNLWNLCKTLNLDEKKQAKWIDKDDRRCLEVYSTVIYPYSATYKNLKDEEKRFIPENEAVFVPKVKDAFTTYYGRADHIEAVSKAPIQFFGALDPLPKGVGQSVLSEMKSIPVCHRPSAVIKAKWKEVV